MAPTGIGNVGIYEFKIADLIPEGSIVKEGDYVAKLDRTEATGKLKDLESDLQKTQSEYDRAKLDTSLDLSKSREELRNMKSSVEEKKILLEQSKYEPPATIRQAKLDLEKADRSYAQNLEDYKLKSKIAKAKILEVAVTLEQKIRKKDKFIEMLDKFDIMAPKSGMLIYAKSWRGYKQTVGSKISIWNPTVATLPYLDTMLSNTYINEVDISKIKKNQKVNISIDAFPDKKFNGKIIEIANVGEQLPKTDAKVFEVSILVEKSDPVLRPSMTTSNSILTSSYDNVLFIPLECVHSTDKTNFVYKVNGSKIVKQKVTLGSANENEIIVNKGLKEGDKLYLTIPENSDKLSFKE